MLWYDNAPNIGYFMPDQNDENKAKWHLDIWSRRLEHIPFARNAKQDFHTWRNVQKRYYDGEDMERWLDSMTYKTYLEKVMGLNHGITKFVDPVLASSMGLGADAISAFGAYQVAMPGFQGFPKGFKRKGRDTESEWHSFPGGNDGFVRYFVKRLVPTAIQGADNFEGIMNGRVNFGALDQPDNRIAIRLDSLVVRIEHDAESDKADYVWVTYLKKGKIFRIRARSVVAASGSFMSRRIVKDLPADYADAYKSFFFSPVLVVNVAVTNWKFLDKLGITACRWFKGFGFSCNIRRPMVIGDYQPPLAPNKPAIITFYVPFYYPGLPVKDQGKKGRLELLSTSYRTYELKIKDQMAELFGKTGFNPDKDIAGIVLNRWGHAYVNPAPGFYFGKDGQSAPREIIRKRFGRIAFAHSELNGHQHWAGAVAEGQRAAKQIMDVL